MARSITVEHGGAEYVGEIMTIESTMLGYEDHGIFTGIIRLKSGSSGQSAGAYFLDDRLGDRADDGPDPHGSAAGVDYIQRVMRAVGVDSWEDLTGRRVIVLRAKAYDTIAGLANVDDDDRLFIFQEWADEWRALRESRKVPS